MSAVTAEPVVVVDIEEETEESKDVYHLACSHCDFRFSYCGIFCDQHDPWEPIPCPRHPAGDTVCGECDSYEACPRCSGERED